MPALCQAIRMNEDPCRAPNECCASGTTCVVDNERLPLVPWLPASGRLCALPDSNVMPVLFASQTAPGGPAVILPALLIAGILIALSQAFVPKNDQ